jgi:hypothetical protein
MAQDLLGSPKGAKGTDESFPSLENLELGRYYPYKAIRSHLELWKAAYWTRDQLRELRELVSAPIKFSPIVNPVSPPTPTGNLVVPSPPIRATFIIPGNAVVGTDIIKTRHIITESGRRPRFAAVNAKIPPTSGPLVVDVTYQNLSIFGPGGLILPLGSDTDTVVWTEGGFVEPREYFVKGSLLKGSILSAGGAGGIEMVLEY